MSLTLSETGKVLTETFEGITMPADYSFDTINDFVHGVDVQFEELQALCLGMACYIDRHLPFNQGLTEYSEKFAELVVEECLKCGDLLVSHYIDAHPEQEQALLLAAIADYSSEIKKHFGVEE